jgi:hypothetical protein
MLDIADVADQLFDRDRFAVRPKVSLRPHTHVIDQIIRVTRHSSKCGDHVLVELSHLLGKHGIHKTARIRLFCRKNNAIRKLNADAVPTWLIDWIASSTCRIRPSGENVVVPVSNRYPM